MDFPWTLAGPCGPYEKLEVFLALLLTPDGDVPEEILQRLKRLLADRDMIPVWEEYRKAFRGDIKIAVGPSDKSDAPREVCITGYEMLVDAVLLVKVWDNYQSGLAPPGEEAEKYKDIAKHATKLARLIKDTDLERGLLRYYLNNLGGGKLALEVKSKFKASGLNVSTSEGLKHIAKMAEATVDAVEKAESWWNLYRYVQKPRSGNAKANYFIRAMSQVFEKDLGSARPRLLARLARVALDDPTIDETTVNTALRDWRKASPNHTAR